MVSIGILDKKYRHIKRLREILIVFVSYGFGEVKINLKHRGLDSLTRKLDQASNRVAYAIVLAALIIGSSLLVLADIPPHWHEMPIIGIIGFVGAAVMGFWLLLSILRHGKM